MNSRLAFIIAVVGFGGMTSLSLHGCSKSIAEAEKEQASQSPISEHEAGPEGAQVFLLSPKKQDAAGIKSEAVTPRELQELRIVPGRIQYDDSRHIEVKVPTAGILLEVRVQPGSIVEPGDVLALVNSPEVGTARADVLRRQAEYEIALKKHEWNESASTGLQQLVEAVLAGQDPEVVAREMAKLKLGVYREQVMTAYTRYRLAKSLAAAVATANDSGALSGRTIRERLSERDSAHAALFGITEQSLFKALQESALSKLEVDDSERRLKISKQVLQTLLGFGESKSMKINEDELSLVELHAPIKGTIESRTFSRGERINQGDSLFILANTSRLWVAADIRELEWEALRLQPGQPLLLTSPALPNQVMTSKVEFVGREVNPQSNAVPLVAAIDNPDGSLRPGQFVWVKLPLGEARRGLAVPESAIVEHDGQSFVFLAESDDHFRRVNIKTGIVQDDMVEVLTGLKAGQQVVVSGAFALKSEMLLEREE